MFCCVRKQSEMDREPYCRFCKKSLISGKSLNTVPVFGDSRNKTLLVDSGQDSVVLAEAFESSRFPLEQARRKLFRFKLCGMGRLSCCSLVSNLTSPCNERTWNLKDTDTIMTSPEPEAPSTSAKRSAALRSTTGFKGYLSCIYSNKRGRRPTRRLPHGKMLLVLISLFFCWEDYALEVSSFSLSKCEFSRLFHTERSWHTYQFTVVFRLCSAGFALWCKSILFDLFWSVKLFIVNE